MHPAWAQNRSIHSAKHRPYRAETRPLRHWAGASGWAVPREGWRPTAEGIRGEGQSRDIASMSVLCQSSCSRGDRTGSAGVASPGLGGGVSQAQGLSGRTDRGSCSSPSFQTHCLPLERCTVTYSLFTNEEEKAREVKVLTLNPWLFGVGWDLTPGGAGFGPRSRAESRGSRAWRWWTPPVVCEASRASSGKELGETHPTLSPAQV